MSTPSLEQRRKALSSRIESFGVAPKKKEKKVYKHSSVIYKSLGEKSAPWSLQPKQVVKKEKTFHVQYGNAKNGITPIKGVDYFTSSEMREMHDAVLSELKTSAAEHFIPQIIDELRKQGLSTSDLKDAESFIMRARDGMMTRYKFEELMHGGGSNTGSTGLNYLVATGTIDNSNTIFTFASTPTIVVVNGASYVNGHGVTIVGTTATLDYPPLVNGNIYGMG